MAQIELLPWYTEPPVSQGESYLAEYYRSVKRWTDAAYSDGKSATTRKLVVGTSYQLVTQ